MAKSVKEKNQLECNKAAREKYLKEKTTSVCIRFMQNTEADLLEYLNSQPNKALKEDYEYDQITLKEYIGGCRTKQLVRSSFSV